jgi:hypothetical protein
MLYGLDPVLVLATALSLSIRRTVRPGTAGAWTGRRRRTVTATGPMEGKRFSLGQLSG